MGVYYFVVKVCNPEKGMFYEGLCASCSHKRLWWGNKIRLLWPVALLHDCFCLSGSNVSCNHSGRMFYFLVTLWQHESRTTIENTRVLVSKMISVIQIFVGVWGTVMVGQSCDFRGPFFGPLRLKMFPVGVQCTWRFGTLAILKMTFTILRSRLEKPWQPPWHIHCSFSFFF